MGSTVKKATSAIGNDGTKLYKTSDAIVTGAGRVGKAVANDPSTLAAVMVNPTMAGSTVGGTKAATETTKQVMAANTDMPSDGGIPSIDPAATDPLDPATLKKKQLLAGRAGTLLTGGGTGTGTNLGASGGRSTLLGL
jgi:hypothetical protein